MGEGHNIPIVTLSQWRRGILFGFLMLSIVLPSLISVNLTSRFVSVVKFFTCFFHPKGIVQEKYRNMDVKVPHTKSSQWWEYQFCDITWSWRHWCAKVVNERLQLLSFHLSRRMYFYLQLTHFYMAIQNVILTLQCTAQWSTGRN